MGNGRAGLYILLTVIAILLVVGILYLTGVFGPREQVVDMDLPEVEAPAVPRPDAARAPEAPGTDAN